MRCAQISPSGASRIAEALGLLATSWQRGGRGGPLRRLSRQIAHGHLQHIGQTVQKVDGGVLGLALDAAKIGTINARIGRKALLVWTFAGIAIIWGLGGLIPGLPTGVLLFAVCAFALLSGASNFLEIVYPNELFPTQVRATAVGIGTAASRIGSASAVYLMPFILEQGVNWVLVAGAAASLLGLIVTLAWGEETMGRALDDVAHAPKQL